MKKWLIVAGLGVSLLCNFITPAQAALNLTLTQGLANAVPIAVVPFGGQASSTASDPNNIAAVISADLHNSGRFTPLAASQMPALPHNASQIQFPAWQALKQNDIIVGQITPLAGNRYQIHFQLANVYQGNPPLLDQQMTVNGNQLRRAAHHISDIVYQTLTGQRGVFSTRIAYISVLHTAGAPAKYALTVADYDGYNPKPILISYSPLMSPAWSHDGTRIAYVSFENQRTQIFTSNVATGQRTLISNYPGLNNAPAWSPDDSKLAVVLSLTGNPKIYAMNLASRQIQQLTSGTSIDTEPNWAPDGQSLLFTSDRGGSPQIYRLQSGGNPVQRMSFNGNYNARASFSPNGQQIVMIHSGANSPGYGIGLQDLQTGAYLVLDNSGDDQSPSFSPNGQMVIFATRPGGGNRQLAIVSTDGRIKLRLPSSEGSVQEPVWSPFLN